MTAAPPLALLAALAGGPARAAELVEWTLSDDDGGFVAAGDTLQWEWGAVASGPGTGFDSPNGWATVLDGVYLHGADDYLVLPGYDLSAAARPVLEIVHWYQVDAAGDLASVEVSVGGIWQVVGPVYGYPVPGGFSGASQGWVSHWFDLSGLADASEARLAFHSDESAALDGWYLGRASIFDGDNVPPDLEYLVVPGDTQDVALPYVVEARVADDSGEATAALAWTLDGGDALRVEMETSGADVWTAGIDPAEPDTEVCWWVEATDGTNDAVGDPECFRVFLARPTGLVGPEGRVVGTTVPLTWEAPDSPHEVLGYGVYRDGALVAEVEDEAADAPIAGPVDTFQVRARYDTPKGEWEGDPSEALVLDTARSRVDSIVPAFAWQGDEVRVTVEGTNLLFADGDVAIDLGQGVVYTDAQVQNVDRVVFTLLVTADAPVGARDVEVTSGDVVVTLEDAFEIGEGALRPALVEVSPDTVEQGERVDLRITGNAAFAGCPRLDLGEGVVVEKVLLGEVSCGSDGAGSGVESAELTATVVVANDAPIGENDILADDGLRVWTGVDLRVRDRTVAAEPVCGCGAAGGAVGPAWVCGLLVIGRRRRR